MRSTLDRYHRPARRRSQSDRPAVDKRDPHGPRRSAPAQATARDLVPRPNARFPSLPMLLIPKPVTSTPRRLMKIQSPASAPTSKPARRGSANTRPPAGQLDATPNPSVGASEGSLRHRSADHALSYTGPGGSAGVIAVLSLPSRTITAPRPPRPHATFVSSSPRFAAATTAPRSPSRRWFLNCVLIGCCDLAADFWSW